LLDEFAKLDDNDIMASIKEWCLHGDVVLSELSNRLINRHLLKIEMRKKAFTKAEINDLKKATAKHFGFTAGEEEYFIISDSITNHAYNPKSDHINLLYKDGSLEDISTAADQLNISALSNLVTKHFVCYPVELR